MSGRGRGRGRGGRGTKPRKSDSAGNSGDKSKKITVENAVYSIGNMTEASNFVATTKILINHIEQRYDQGEAVVQYIDSGTDFDFPTPLRPIILGAAGKTGYWSGGCIPQHEEYQVH